MKRRLGLVLVWLAPVLCFAQAPMVDEKPLWELWQFHLANSNNHVEVAAKCAELAKATQYYPLNHVVEGLGAWHLLVAGQTNAATKILGKMADLQAATPPLVDAAAVMGKTWLTRLDREAVRRALQAYYRQAVEYPTNFAILQTLPPEWRPPAKDRFGKNWSYRIVSFKYLRGFKNQKYELTSSALDTRSDLAAALKVPYGAEIRLKPVKIMAATPGRETLSFEYTDDKGKAQTAFVAVGSKSGNVVLAYVGAKLIVLSDGSHWMVLPKPR